MSHIANNKARRAIVLLSGGLDSMVSGGLAREQGFHLAALTIDYNQRHRVELEAAKRVAAALGVDSHVTLPLNLRAFGGSALTDAAIAVPEQPTAGIPVTYVPARNTLMLSLALGWAEVVGAAAIYVGVNAIDYSGYPDCRPAFIAAFAALATVATRAGVEGRPIAIEAPLLHMTKAEVIRTGLRLGVDYGQTGSCYQPDDGGRACGRCDACRLRREGFAAAGVTDPTRYA